MQNLMKTEQDKLRKLSLIFLNIYFLCTVYERHAQLNFLSSLGIYAFLGISMLYIINKRSVVGISNVQFTVRFLLCIMAEFSLLWINEPSAPSYAHRFLTSVIIAFVIGNLIYTEKDLKMVMFGYCLAGAFLSYNFFMTYGKEIFSLAQKVQEAERLGGEYGNVNEVAQKCLFSLIICVYYALFDKSIGKWRKPAIWDAVVCFMVILFTGSRKAFIIAIIAIVLMFLKYSKTKSPATRIRYITIGAVLVFIMVTVVIKVPIFSAYKERFNVLFQVLSGNAAENSKSDLLRINFITEGLKNFGDKMLFGGGICYSYEVFNGFYTHNNYVEILLNFGIVGFVMYYGGYVANFVNLFRMKNVNNSNINILFLVLMCAIMIYDIGVVTYYDRYICIILSAIAGYFANKVDHRVCIMNENKE